MKNTNFIHWMLLGLFIFSASCISVRSDTSSKPKVKGFNYTFPKDQHGNQVIAKDSYCRLVDGSGETIIPGGKYIYIKPLNYDKSCGTVLYKAEAKDGIDLYDGKGKLLAGNDATDFNGCIDGLIKIRKGDSYGVIDTEGKEIIPVQYDGIKLINKDSIYVYTGDMRTVVLELHDQYELDAYFNGKLTKDVEPYSDVPPKIIQHMPRFPGCENSESAIDEKKRCAGKKLLEYIYKNVKYPALARTHGIEGTASVSFTVEKNGSITNPKIRRDAKGGCGDEALRVVKTMPKWIPGKQHGQPVSMQFNLPVRFKLHL